MGGSLRFHFPEIVPCFYIEIEKRFSNLPIPKNEKKPNGGFSQSVFSSPYIESRFPMPQYIVPHTGTKHYILYAFNRSETPMQALN